MVGNQGSGKGDFQPLAPAIAASIFATEWSPATLQSEKYLLSLEGIFRKVRQLGCDWVHLVYIRNFTIGDVPRIEELIARHGVGVSCIHSMTLLNRPCTPEEFARERDQLQDAIEIAARLDAGLVACNFGENQSRDEETAIAECKRQYESCFMSAADLGITVVVENTCSAEVGEEITTTTEGILKLLREVGSSSFQFHFDPGNLQSVGVEAYPFAYELLKEHIRLIHLKDVVKYNAGERYHRRAQSAGKLIGTESVRYVSVPLGQGEVNLEGLIGSLAQDGYGGFLDIEPHTVEDRLDEFYVEGLEFVARHCPGPILPSRFETKPGS